MNIIKLSATNSTNDYLKDLARQTSLENWTVVWSKNQTEGRGQQDNKWFTEKDNNLTISILINKNPVHYKHQFYLNRIVSLAILKVIQDKISASFSVKWPNDIMAENKKIAGILIENTIKQEYIVQSIIGIGLNVNQKKFPKVLPNAISMQQLTGQYFDIEALMIKIVEAIQDFYAIDSKSDVSYINDTYEQFLFNKNKISVFKKENYLFNGVIKGVSPKGKLCLMHENKQICCYNSHEIKQVL
jgi:BirA family biotin operon repressor/biotin-[acetyl-CoA-carboxylase] ligase